jgi:hypothetical protein
MQSVAVLACVMRDAEEKASSERSGFELLCAEMIGQCDHLMEMYAWVLGCRGMILQAAAIRSKRWPAHRSRCGMRERESQDKEVAKVAPVDAEFTATLARQVAVYCSVCRLPVRGLSNTCALCGHTGHISCLRGWFVDACQNSCPAGCVDCRCIDALVTRLDTSIQ